jgi:hypothetical protein
MQVAPGIYSMAQRKGAYVHAFLLDDGDGLTLVDTLYDSDAHRILAELQRIGKSVADIKHIVMTHCHRSHLGGLALLKEQSGAPVYAHEWEADLIAGAPITMIFSAPLDQQARTAHLSSGGPLRPWFRRFLILVVGVFFLFGAMLIINPAWLDLRWPWDLNEFDARIMAAWLMGWAVWAGTMVMARDWDEIRLAGALGIVFGVAVSATLVAFRPEFDLARSPTRAYAGLAVVFTAAMIFFTWRQERHRPRRLP